jgi:hypothetical protein
MTPDAEELRAIKQRRLRELEKQAAFLGAECPVHIRIEITDLRHELGIALDPDTHHDSVLTLIHSAALLDEFIASQHRFLRMYFLIAGTLFALGVIITLVAYLVTQALVNLWSLGGLFVTSLCVVPVREIMTRQEKIGIYAALKTRLSAIEAARDTTDLIARQRIDELVWRVVEKTAMG